MRRWVSLSDKPDDVEIPDKSNDETKMAVETEAPAAAAANVQTLRSGAEDSFGKVLADFELSLSLSANNKGQLADALKMFKEHDNNETVSSERHVTEVETKLSENLNTLNLLPPSCYD